MTREKESKKYIRTRVAILHEKSEIDGEGYEFS